MTDNNSNFIGNSSTIFKTIGLLIAGYTTPWLINMICKYFGVDLSGQETQIMQNLGLLIGLILSYIDAKYSNTFFKKHPTVYEYVQYGIDNFGADVTVEDGSSSNIIQSGKVFINGEPLDGVKSCEVDISPEYAEKLQDKIQSVDEDDRS